MSWFDERPWLKTTADNEAYNREIPDTTMVRLFQRAVANNPDGAAIRYYGTTLTYRQLDEYTAAFASALTDAGFAAGDRVAVYLQNVPAYPIAVLGTWRIGGQIVPLNPMYRDELDHIFADAKPSVLVVSEQAWVTRVAPHASDIPHVFTVGEADFLTGEVPPSIAPLLIDEPTGQPDFLTELTRRKGQRPKDVDVALEDIALVGYTSGTSGRSKGAELTHVGLAYNGQMIPVQYGFDSTDATFTLAPVFHITGFVTQMLGAIANASALVMNYRFEPVTSLALMRDERPAFMAGPATAFVALMAHPEFRGTEFDSFKVINSGGAPVPESLVERFEAQTGHYIGQGYGLTETSAQCAVVPLGMRAPVNPETGNLSTGLPSARCFIRIIDLDGREVGPGEVGEICVRGHIVATAYLNNPEATARDIPDGELRTGDMGFMDENGWLFIVDRKKDMINASGYKVWPREVEDTLYRHPAVLEAAVVGVPDEYRGETVAAYISLRAGAEASEDDIITYCREHLAAYKAPTIVRFIDEVPKNASGKILRREVRADALSQLNEAGSTDSAAGQS